MKDDLKNILKDKIPIDTSEQYNVFKMIDHHKNSLEKESTINVLDLGAGSGTSFDRVKKTLGDIEWKGLDIENSPEVSKRSRSDLAFYTYDGKTFPFEDQTFDLIISKQVMEHVRYPDLVVNEVNRCLKDGGVFIGSVSQLEPYHSYSIQNFTLYGIVILLESNGLFVEELRPGIDGLSMILRRLFGTQYFSSMFSNVEGILNHFISAQYIRKNDVWNENFQKLIYAGHIVWFARKV